jgi:Raf kinase inhibitor-like YbhB/YbcL family protein
MAPRLRTLVVAACGLALAACGDGPADPGAGAPMSVEVTSPDFGDGDMLPVDFTCDGRGTWPSLAWKDDEEDVGAWALVVDDPDAPGDTFVHWVLLDLPLATRAVESGQLPAGAVQAENSAEVEGWTAPCPPSGGHRYRFTVYGLSEPTGLDDGVSLESALDAIDSGAVDRGRITGTYGRG